MNIAICSNCMWLGTREDLLSPVSEFANELIEQLVKANGLVKYCCPKCDSTDLYVKPGNHFVASQEEQCGEPDEDEFAHEPVDNHDDVGVEIIERLFNSAERSQEAFNEMMNEPIREPRPPAALCACTCIDCQEEFRSKIATNRCNKCNEIFLSEQSEE